MKLLSKLPVTNCNHNIKAINHVEKHDHDLVWFRIRLTPTLFCSDSPGMGLLVAIARKWKVRRSDPKSRCWRSLLMHQDGSRIKINLGTKYKLPNWFYLDPSCYILHLTKINHKKTSEDFPLQKKWFKKSGLRDALLHLGISWGITTWCSS